jgi:hypothetical protein
MAAVFFLASTVFVYRSFYGMRIKSEGPAPATGAAAYRDPPKPAET